MNGYLLIDKKEDWTSRDVVSKISHILHEKKVGHSGTLDPFATGLLVIAIGTAVKANVCMGEVDKEYVATLKLGSKTTSGDRTNEVVETKEVRYPIEQEIKDVLKSMVGKQKQVPPMVSAVHYKGQKLFHLALQGIEVDRPARDIEIYELELLKYEGDEITFRARVSKGTYIRVLGEDIAEKLGNLGHLVSLRRTKVGPFDVKDAIDVSEASEDKLIDSYDVLSKIATVVELDEKNTYKAYHGAPLNSDISSVHDTILVADKNKTIIAIYRYDNDKFMCQRGINSDGNNSI